MNRGVFLAALLLLGIFGTIIAQNDEEFFDDEMIEDEDDLPDYMDEDFMDEVPPEEESAEINVPKNERVKGSSITIFVPICFYVL